MTLSSAEGIQVLSRSRLSPRVGYLALIALGIAGVAVLYTFDPRNPARTPSARSSDSLDITAPAVGRFARCTSSFTAISSPLWATTL